MSNLPQGPLEVVKAFVKAAAFDRDEAAAKALLTKASLEGGGLNPPPDAHEMTYEYGEPREENGEWFVPLKIINPKQPDQPPMEMQFAPVIEDGVWKLDMQKMMERMLGGTGLNEVVDAMKQAMEGVGNALAEGMKQAFEGIGSAFSETFQSSASNEQLNKLPDDVTPAMKAIFDQFYEQDLPDQQNLMREAIGNDLSVYVDWHTFYGDDKAAKKLSRKVLDNVRSAVCLSSSDDKVQAGMREQLREVVISHVPYPEGKSLRLEGGRLQITVNLQDGSGNAGYYSSSDIMAAIREGLDADKGPAVDRLLGEVIPQLREEMRDKLDLDLEIDIDLASFTEGFDTDTAVSNLKKIEDDIFRNFIYHVREVKEKVPSINNLLGFRLEHVGSSRHRALIARGSRIIYRMCFTDDYGYFGANELEYLLPGVVCTLPDYSDPDTPTSGSEFPPDFEGAAFEHIARYRDRIFGDQSINIQQSVGKQLNIDVDWASISDDHAAANLQWWGLNRVVGAVRFAKLNEEAAQDMEDTLTGVMLHNVATIDEKRIEIDSGVLHLYVCLGEDEKGCFYERDIAQKLIESMGSEFKPMIKDIREAAQYWEKELRENPEYGANVTYYIDFAGFTSSPEDQKNKFALTLLKEHGVDALFYGVTGLFESNPNFKEQFIERVHRFVISHVDDPKKKNVHSYDDAIVYELYLHEGYKGYLTIDDMKKKLPKIVAEMKAPEPEHEEAAERHVSYGVEEATELGELLDLANEDAARIAADEADAAGEREVTDAAAQAFSDARVQIEATLPAFSAQFQAFLGKPIAMEIDWDSLEGDAVAMGQLLNLCLSPLLGGIMTAAQDASYRDDLGKHINHIVMRRVKDEDEQAIRLDEGELLMAVCVESDRMTSIDPDQAAAIFKGMIDHVRAAKVAPTSKPKRSTKEKPAASKPKAKPAAPAKKPATKPPAKKAEKPRNKGDDKPKGKGKK